MADDEAGARVGLRQPGEVEQLQRGGHDFGDETARAQFGIAAPPRGIAQQVGARRAGVGGLGVPIDHRPDAAKAGRALVNVERRRKIVGGKVGAPHDRARQAMRVGDRLDERDFLDRRRKMRLDVNRTGDILRFGERSEFGDTEFMLEPTGVADEPLQIGCFHHRVMGRTQRP